MWSYNHTDELYHYGVKGMKWGVRRDRAKRARTAAWIGYANKQYGRDINSLQRKKASNEAKGLSNKKVNAQLKQKSTEIKNRSDLRDKLISDLSEKEIKAGERYLKLAGLGGAVGSMVYASVKEKDVQDRLIKERM